MIAAPRSGAGKTTITLALIAALRRRGFSVHAAKSGPDYIDPAFHAAASGHPSRNLDSWAMPPSLLDAVASRVADGAEIVVVESAMGIFDGLDDPPGARGAAADLAARFSLPVVLVLDVSGQSQSAAAVARGFFNHDPGVRIAGVVLNRVASERHARGIFLAMTQAGFPVLGSVARDAGIALPERHLGLVQASEHPALPALFEKLADLAEKTLDIDAILAAAAPFAPPPARVIFPPPPGQRIALAADAAFSFLYPHIVDGWRDAGAEVVPFSPLANEEPGGNCDVAWLPGGYPELHAGRLANAEKFRASLRRFAETRPVHGECGGYMVLGETLEDAAGTRHAMLGLLGHHTSFARRRMNLGYRAAVLRADCPLGREGDELRGHEFHYATVTDPGSDAPLVNLRDGRGADLGAAGSRRGHVSGTFFHVIAGCLVRTRA
jgi:cobyrinic acid a,c-diamide synthase